MKIDANKIWQVINDNHGTINQVVYNAPGINPLPNTIPSINGFVGREDCLSSLCDSYRNGTRCFILHGIGGIGKTALALRLASEIADDFQAKIFVEMQGMDKTPRSWRDAMFEIVRQFNPELPADIPDEHLRTIFIQSVQNQNTLIVLDNVENKQAVEPLRMVSACFITTSRESFAVMGGKSVKVEKMRSEDARQLLFQAADEKRFDERADELSEIAGYLPMALKPLASILAEDELETAADLIQKYRDKKELLKERVPDYNDLTIAASFELSYEKLSPEMQERWRRLSVFPSSFEETAMILVLMISETEARETQRKLRRSSLLEVNVETRRFSLHDLVRVFTNEKLSEDERFQTQLYFAQHYLRILLSIEEYRVQQPENYYLNALGLIDDELENIKAGQKWSSEFSESDTGITEFCMYYSVFAFNFIRLRLHPNDAISWQKSALSAARKLNDKFHESVILGSLGAVLACVGDYREAIAYEEKALAICRELGDLEGEGRNLSNLGNIYYKLKEYSKTVENCERALTIFREFENPHGEASCLRNLAGAYYGLSEYERAIECIKKSLEIFIELDDYENAGGGLDELGTIYMQKGEFRKALECSEQSLAISQEIGNLSGEATSLSNLGFICLNLGEFQQAADFYAESLEISREINDPLGEANSLGQLGLVLYNLGELQKAVECNEKSLIISRRIGDLEGEAGSLSDLALVYCTLGDFRAAIECCEQSQTIFREKGDRAGEAATLNTFGTIYHRLGELQNAIDCYEQALSISREIGYPMGQGESLKNLGVVYMSIERKKIACEFWMEALEIYEAVESPNANTIRRWINEQC